MGGGIYGWDIYASNGWGSYGKELLFLEDMLKTPPELQGSTLSSHHMTTGFSSIELLTRGLLRKGQDHSHA